MHGHMLSFIGFIHIRYVSVFVMMLQSSGTVFSGWVFLGFYSVISAMHVLLVEFCVLHANT